MEENMKSRNILGLLLLIVLAIGLTACTRSASTAPDASTIPGPEAATQEGMNMIQELATQTAIAESGQLPSDGTPQPTVDPLGSLPPLDGGTATVAAPADGTSPDAAVSSPTPELVAVAQPTVETVRPATYTLQKGEFPYCIARRFNVNPADLLSMNGLSVAQSSALQPGLVLKVPSSGAFGAERALLPHPAQYTVQAGDSIYSIACKYGDVDPVNIAAVNALAAPYTLTVGTVLQIP
jgi:LysM repeat protein